MEETQRVLTTNEAYDEIINQGLYAFGAQNPVNVVRILLIESKQKG